MTPRHSARLLAIVCMMFLLAGNLSAAAWKEKVLYSFQGSSDGSIPAGGVVLDASGNLYGVTSLGGASFCTSTFECGTVYQLQRPSGPGKSWTYVKLHQFKGHDHGDGSTPEGGLLIDANGNLYGTTQYGGNGPCVLLGTSVGCGTVFQLIPPKQKGGTWTEKILHHFQGNKDGYSTHGDLVVDASGNLYGATVFGGGGGQSTCDQFYPYCGTIFEVSPPKTKGGKWTEKVLYSFQNKNDGAVPNGSLVFDKQGALYGTTPCGGDAQCLNLSGGNGVLFRLQPPNIQGKPWTFKLIHTFTGGTDGAGPNGGMIFDAKGSLLGTAGGGGAGRVGLVFSFNRAGGKWAETVLHEFSIDKGGRGPRGPIVFDGAGNLYGTAFATVGDKFGGLVFTLQPGPKGKWSFAVLHEFGGNPDGAYPEAALTIDDGGNIFSTTGGGGTGTGCQSGCGTVFEVSAK